MPAQPRGGKLRFQSPYLQVSESYHVLHFHPNQSDLNQNNRPFHGSALSAVHYHQYGIRKIHIPVRHQRHNPYQQLPELLSLKRFAGHPETAFRPPYRHRKSVLRPFPAADATERFQMCHNQDTNTYQILQSAQSLPLPSRQTYTGYLMHVQAGWT